MNTLIFSGAAIICIGFVIWAAMREAHKQGAAEQAEKNLREALDVEDAVHQTQAEHRETATTKRRLEDGSF